MSFQKSQKMSRSKHTFNCPFTHHSFIHPLSLHPPINHQSTHHLFIHPSITHPPTNHQSTHPSPIHPPITNQPIHHPSTHQSPINPSITRPPTIYPSTTGDKAARPVGSSHVAEDEGRCPEGHPLQERVHRPHRTLQHAEVGGGRGGSNEGVGRKRNSENFSFIYHPPTYHHHSSFLIHLHPPPNHHLLFIQPPPSTHPPFIMHSPHITHPPFIMHSPHMTHPPFIMHSPHMTHPPFMPQEVLQAHLDSQLRGVERQGLQQPDLSYQHHDGPTQVLQPPLPLPCCREGLW